MADLDHNASPCFFTPFPFGGGIRAREKISGIRGGAKETRHKLSEFIIPAPEIASGKN